MVHCLSAVTKSKLFLNISSCTVLFKLQVVAFMIKAVNECLVQSNVFSVKE